MAKKHTANPNDFILPDLGEGVHEAELISWKVTVGQTVSEHEILAEMETDKALVEVPSPRGGTISQLWGEPGEIMKVGEPLVSYEGSQGAATGDTKRGQVGGNGHKSQPETPKSEPEREDAGTVVGTMSGAIAGVTSESGKALATPAVRRLARDMGVDINAIAGTGIAGRVTERDVRAAADGGAPVAPPRSRPVSVPATAASPTRAAPPSAPPPARPAVHIPHGEDTARIPFRGVRRTIANRLRQSVDNAVHFTVMDDADVTALDETRRRLAAASGEKISFLPFVASAVCRALTGKFPQLNSVVDDEREEIVQHRAVHLGVATDTDTGLMVPVIRDCDALGVMQVGREINRVAAGARDRSLPREQLMGSSFTISNVGSHAGRFATPIINYPEVAILAVGRARDSMVTKNGWFKVGKLLPLSLACDHRVVDGAAAALCLAEIIAMLQEPDSLLAPARA